MAPNWPIPAAMAGIPKDRHSRHVRRDLLEQLQPFRAHAVFEIVKPVALPPGRARLATKPAPTGSSDVREHDRHGAGRLQQRRHGRAASGQNDVRRERDQFRRVSANVVGIACGPAVVDPHVAAVGPAQLLQPLQERRDAGLRFRIVRGCELISTPMRRIRSGCCARAASGHAAAAAESVMNSRRLIRSPRRRGRAASAALSRPSALAVLRLITSSYLVGACTGRSAGFSPLRMRST